MKCDNWNKYGRVLELQGAGGLGDWGTVAGLRLHKYTWQATRLDIMRLSIVSACYRFSRVVYYKLARVALALALALLALEL